MICWPPSVSCKSDHSQPCLQTEVKNSDCDLDPRITVDQRHKSCAVHRILLKSIIPVGFLEIRPLSGSLILGRHENGATSSKVDSKMVLKESHCDMSLKSELQFVYEIQNPLPIATSVLKN